MKFTTVFVGILILAFSTQTTSAQLKKNSKYPPLDAPYVSLKKPTKVVGRGLKNRNDIEGMINAQTEIKSQGGRGTCSIFASTALLEALIIKRYRKPTTLNLSEEWLQYIISKGATDEGSDTRPNFNAITKYGMPSEEKLNYIPESWQNNLDADIPNEEHGSRSRERCEHLRGIKLKSCLIGHWDTAWLDLSDSDLMKNSKELYEARVEAFRVRDTYQFKHKLKVNWVSDTSKIKQLLSTGTPLILGLDFYYGAWNHGESEELGIDADQKHWSEGKVGYPEPNSVDLENTAKDPAGHSILVVGYDDSVIIERTTMRKVPRVDRDGNPVYGRNKKPIIDIKPVKAKYQGVYYFKNSWGKGNFGKNFKINGKLFPGYGMITYKYAEEYGSFDQVTLK